MDIVKITSLTSDGSGIGHIDNMAVFVNDTVPGDECEVKITKKKKSYALADLKKIITPSPYRIDPVCSHFGKCGGCAIMNLSYEKQLDEKCSIINNAMKRIGKFNDFKLDKITGCTNAFEYRNKIVFAMKNGSFGFYENKTHTIIPVDRCFLADKSFSDIAASAAQFADGSIFIRQGAKGKAVDIKCGCNTDIHGLCSAILNADRTVESIFINNKCVYGKNTIIAGILGLKFEVSPQSFLQVNYEMTEKLYKCALDFANLDKTGSVIDIYCGIGTISLAAAVKAKNVTGVEIVPQAIENARRNAHINDIKNAEFFADSAEKIVPELIENGLRPDVVILDPPRKGSDEKTISSIISANPQRIVYVSCDPATLARDCAKFCEEKYKIEKAQAFDMFPQTMHVETVCLMSRKEK